MKRYVDLFFNLQHSLFKKWEIKNEIPHTRTHTRTQCNTSTDWVMLLGILINISLCLFKVHKVDTISMWAKTNLYENINIKTLQRNRNEGFFLSFRRRRRRWFKLCRHTMEEAWAKKYTLNSFTCISVSINHQYQYVYQIWSMSVKWMVMLRFCVLRWKLVRWRMVEWMLFVWKVKYGTEKHTGRTQNEQQQK